MLKRAITFRTILLHKPEQHAAPTPAATLPTAIGDNHVRISTEATLVKLCGERALEASSGKAIRHRLNPVLSLGQFLFE